MATEQLPAPQAGAAVVIPGAAQLAARIQIPRRLPPRYDGQPLAHLSHSSYTRFVLCPESWRRHYVCGERHAPTGSMFLGRCVDDAITLYYRRILEHGERLSPEQVKDAYRDAWHAQAEAEAEQLGIAWEDDTDAERAFGIGLDAIELSFRELVPRLGEPVAVQRKLEFTLAPGLEWSVQSYLDLETLRRDHGETIPAVVDYKVKSTPLTEYKADSDFQPSVYLAGRWLEGDPVFRIGGYLSISGSLGLCLPPWAGTIRALTGSCWPGFRMMRRAGTTLTGCGGAMGGAARRAAAAIEAGCWPMVGASARAVVGRRR